MMEITNKQVNFLGKLPQFDPSWSDQVKDKWFTSIKEIMSMPQEKEWSGWASFPLKGGRNLQINVYGKITSAEDIDHIIEGLKITRGCYEKEEA